jgi:hypothetical protein
MYILIYRMLDKLERPSQTAHAVSGVPQSTTLLSARAFTQLCWKQQTMFSTYYNTPIHSRHQALKQNAPVCKNGNAVPPEG